MALPLDPQQFRAIALKHRSDRDTHHQIFIGELTAKKRSVCDPDLPIGKTLFVINVPPYVHKEHLIAGFSEATGGEVAHVVMADRFGVRLLPAAPEQNAAPSRLFCDQSDHLEQFKSAFVVFRLTKSLRQAVETISEVRLYQNDKTILETGLSLWTREYLADVPDEPALEAEVNEYMAVFERTEEEQRRIDREQQVDEEGWQVVKKGRGAGFEKKESTLKRLEDKIEEGKKKKELLNFYRFQIRDSKKQHVVGLRQRFEEDKRKIESMKKARNFRPY